MFRLRSNIILVKEMESNMRNFCIALIAATALCLAAPAFAGNFSNNDNTTNTATGGSGGQGGDGTGVGIGQGGNARGGDARSNSNSRSGANAGANAGAGVFGSGNSSTRVDLGVRNNNNNDSNAHIGDVGSTSGNVVGTNSNVDFGGDFGNSRNDNTLGQQQGQQQGQATDQANDQTTTIDASDRSSTVYKERKNPVASAAPVFATACSSGVSAQTMGFGGSLASTNPMCDLALAAEMARAGGDEELSQELMQRAASYARARSNVMRRWSQYLPIIGNIY